MSGHTGTGVNNVYMNLRDNALDDVLQCGPTNASGECQNTSPASAVTISTGDLLNYKVTLANNSQTGPFTVSISSIAR